MEPLAPIPTPPAQRWREFRIQALPVLTFIAVVACVVVLWQNYIIPTNVVAHVEVVQSHIMTSVPGKLVAMNVQQFQRVTKGQVIGAIVATNPETTAAEISAAHADLKVQKTQMVIAQQRSIIRTAQSPNRPPCCTQCVSSDIGTRYKDIPLSGRARTGARDRSELDGYFSLKWIAIVKRTTRAFPSLDLRRQDFSGQRTAAAGEFLVAPRIALH